MIEPELSAARAVGLETVQQSIALSYVKAWQKLPRASADLLGTALPVLAGLNPRDDPVILLSADAFGDNQSDAHRKAWKGLQKAANAVHQAKVRHLWYQWNQETGKEHPCVANLVWTTEVHIDQVVREIELVFWPHLFEYLPAILTPIRDFATRPPPATIVPTASRGLTRYFLERQG